MTRHLPDSDVVYLRCCNGYKQEQTPLAVIAGKSMDQAPAVTGRRKVRVRLVFV